MKINISLSLDEHESAAWADRPDATLAIVEDSEGNKIELCAARGACHATLDAGPVTITTNKAPATDTGKKKGSFRR